MKYFIIVSFILHIIAMQVFQGFYRPSSIGNGYKIIEVGYIEKQARSAKALNSKPKNKSVKSERLNISDFKEKQKQIKEEVVLEKKKEEQAPAAEEAVLDERNGKISGFEPKKEGQRVYEASGGSFDGKTGDPAMILWFSKIKNKIEGMVKYPEQARKKNIQGETLLEIALKNNGYLDSIKIFKSSGSKILDDEAVKTVRAAEPFQPPQEINFNKVFLRVPIRFAIKK